MPTSERSLIETVPEDEDLGLTQAQRDLLEARLEDERMYPGDESPWEMVRKRLLSIQRTNSAG